MSIITRMRKQTAIYWAITDWNAFGQPVFADPVEISCRWEDITEKFIDKDGDVQLSRAKVYVDRDISVGSFLKLGSLDSGTDTATPRNNTGAWEVRRFEKLPNLRATEYLRTAIL